MAKVKIKMYLHGDKETAWQIGKNFKLKGIALENFMYALYEVEFLLEVDTETGHYKILKVKE